jgi:hypothetical protein
VKKAPSACGGIAGALGGLMKSSAEWGNQLHHAAAAVVLARAAISPFIEAHQRRSA